MNSSPNIKQYKTISCNNSPNNFVKHMRSCSHQIVSISQQYEIGIHRFKGRNIESNVSNQNLQNLQKMQGQTSKQQKNITIIRLQTVPYDCCQIIGQNEDPLYIASCKAMPVRIFKINREINTWDVYGSITSKKPNSQKYLSPIRLSQQDLAYFGAGQKFMAEYDLQKLTAHNYACMDKTNLSQIAILSNQQIIAGSFQGNLHFVDRKTEKIIESMTPHMDSITSIVPHPTNSTIFATAARKDNYKYVWDRRMLNSFVYSLEDALYSNQRVGITWARNGQILISGSENGKILQWNFQGEHIQLLQPGLNQEYNQNIMKTEYQLCSQKTIINSVVSLNFDQVAFSTGTRVFDPVLMNEMQTNKIGIIKI